MCSKVIFLQCQLCNLLLLNWFLLGVEMNLGHTHKTRFWYLLGVFSNIFDEHPRHFYRGVPPPGLVVSQRLRFSPARILASLKSTSVKERQY